MTPQKNVNKKDKVTKSKISKSNAPTPQVIKQSNVYHKQSFHKNRVTKVKTKTHSVDHVTKMSNDVLPRSNGASKIP